MTGLLLWIIGAVAAVAGGVVGRWLGRAEGKRVGKLEVERDAMADKNKRMESGRSAVGDGRDAGTPDDRLRRNDGAW